MELAFICINAPGWKLDEERKNLLQMKMIEIKGRMDPSWVWKLRKVLWAEKPDLVLTHGFNGAFAAAIANSGPGPGFPIVSSWHGDYFPGTFIQKCRKPFFDAIEKMIYRKMVGDIVTVSAYSKNRLLAKGVDGNKITVIHNGIPECGGSKREAPQMRADLKIPEGSFFVGTACRLTAAKGLKWLLHSIARVVKERQDVRFVIWGDGPEKRYLSGMASDLEIETFVLFPGHRPDVECHLPSLDLFVMSSISENFSISLLEAMRAGLPIVATDVGGNPEAITNGVHGILVPSANPQAMADGILALLEDPSLREKMGRQARERFLAEFTSDVMIRKTAHWLEECRRKRMSADPAARRTETGPSDP